MVKAKASRAGKAKPNQPKKVVSFWTLIKKTAALVRQNPKTYASLCLIYAVFVFILVQAPTRLSTEDIQQTIAESLPDQANNSTLIAGVLVGEASNVGQTATAYSTILFLIFSMASIWLIRSMYEGKKVKVKEGFYKGMYALIPFTLVCFVILLQLLPVAVGGFVYSIINTNGLVVNLAETVIVWTILGALILWSAYMITSSFQALYIASLPDVPPLLALKEAKKLVKGRRAKVMFKIILGALTYGLLAFAGLLVIITFAPIAASSWWWLVGLLALPIGHTYLYSLYRSLM